MIACERREWGGDRDRILRRRLMGASCAASMSVSMMTSGGCAINDTGPFVSVRHFENDTTHVVELEMWGVHLITNELDAGLTIGHSKKIYLYQKRDASAMNFEDPLTLLTSLHEVSRLHETTAGTADAGPGAPVSVAELDRNDRLVAFASNCAGVMLHADAHRAGVTIGMNSHAALQLPLDFDGVVLIDFDSSRVADGRYLIKERIK